MTTHISSEKHRVPPDRYNDLVERCLAEYKAREKRRAFWRIIGYTALWLATFGVSYVLWLLVLEAIK